MHHQTPYQLDEVIELLRQEIAWSLQDFKMFLRSSLFDSKIMKEISTNKKNDLVFYTGKAHKKSVEKALKHLELAEGYNEVFRYNNVLPQAEVV